jgi:BNR repeat-like domain
MVLRISLASLLSFMLGVAFFAARSAAGLAAKDAIVEIQGSRADAAITMFVERVSKVASVSAGQSWQQPRAHEQALPESTDCWEPALAVGPRGQVYVVAGRRHGTPRDKDFDQQQVIWRSENRGATFEAPRPITTEGLIHADQRIAVDAKGAIYVSYMDWVKDATGRRHSRLRLARSGDGGRTFLAHTATTERVIDKPELAVSNDGKHLYIVYESSPGPRVIASHDGGVSWTDPTVIASGEGRHFWPEALAVASDGSIWLAVPSMSDSDIAKGKPTPVTLHVLRSADGGRSWNDFPMSSSIRVKGRCPHRPDCPVKINTISIAVDARSRAHVLYTEGAAPDQPYALYYRSSSDSGKTWSSPYVLSAAPRPQSGDTADHDYISIATSGNQRVCAAWVDDRRGALDVWARCSNDAGRRWGAETLLSDRSDGAPYKSPTGFKAFYGHYGGAAIDVSGGFHVVWAAGEPGYLTGSVWVNSIDARSAGAR